MAGNATPRIYHISPWRYLWIWFVFGPLALVFFNAGIFSSDPKERAGLLIGGAMFLAVTLFIHVLVRFARLELSANGLRLRQIGYRLEAPWSDITDLWLDRGHESLVTSQPVGGKGAALLAASGRGMSNVLIGASIYTADQQAALDQFRLIPIEAFAWHLRHGNLRADLEHFAPHLRAQLARLDAPPTSAPASARAKNPRRPLSPRDWLVIALILLGVAGMFAFAMGSKEHTRILTAVSGALFSGSFALYTALGARQCYRIGSRLAGTGLAILSLTFALWTFAQLANLGDTLGKGLLGTQLFVLLLFTFVTWWCGQGALKLYHRHRWFLATLLLLATAFTLLCTFFTTLDVIKSFR